MSGTNGKVTPIKQPRCNCGWPAPIAVSVDVSPAEARVVKINFCCPRCGRPLSMAGAVPASPVPAGHAPVPEKPEMA